MILFRNAPVVAIVLVAGGVLALAHRSQAGEINAVPPPVVDESAPSGPTETAILAGGCFWGVQGVFQHVKGVTQAVSGYAGGVSSTATYDAVSTGTTGHAESVKVTFDPRKISYGKILQVYFSAAHNPTELNRQGPDTGTQYRSAIFPTSDEQARIARAYKQQLDAAKVFARPVVTAIEPGKSFYPAEAHHQDFLARNPNYPYIAINDIPKVEAVEKMYPSIFRPEPVLVAGSNMTD